MKSRYLIYIRGKHTGGKVWWLEDTQTGERKSLRTKDKATAQEILLKLNRPFVQAAYHAQMARTHLLIGNPENANRTWQMVMDSLINKKKGVNKGQYERVFKRKTFDKIRNIVVAETKSDDFERVLDIAGVSANMYLRRLQNYAKDMNWLLAPVIPNRAWPPVEHAEKRAITFEEHQKILERENNPERKAFYQICWFVGGSQTDMAELKAENIDWRTRTLSYFRKKTKQISNLKFGEQLAAIFQTLPTKGLLFPYLATVRESDRATEFRQRCGGLGIKGVTLHCYRYAWAERAKRAGYPERFAQEALGHGSKAVARAYAKNASVTLPSLEDFETKSKVMNTLEPPCEQSALAA